MAVELFTELEGAHIKFVRKALKFISMVLTDPENLRHC